MKKFFVMLIVIAIVIGSTSDVFVYAKKLLFGEPTTHVIEKGEYFSKIAKQYYGNSDYWRELALINRAPNSNLVFPGEEIIIPRLEVLQQIRMTKHLSRVNEFVRGEQDVIAHLKSELNGGTTVSTTEPMASSDQATSTITTEQPVQNPAPIEQPVAKPLQSSSLPMVVIFIAVVFLVSLISFIFYRRKKRNENITIVGDSEPDYKNYLKSKKGKSRQVSMN
jgi:hypothetical protein